MKKFLAFIIVAAMAVSSAFAADSAADQKRGKKSKAELKEVTWTVNLHCENCVEKVNENLAFEKGVKDLKVSLEEGTVYIKYDSSKTSEETLAAAMKKLGYEVSAACDCGHDHSHTAEAAHECTAYVCEHGHTHIIEGNSHSHHGHVHFHDGAHSGASLDILNEKSINIVFAIISIITLFFTATASEHFIKDHLWKHVLKRHMILSLIQR